VLRPRWVQHDLDTSSPQLNMKPLRILVVDDSVVIRKLLSDTLSKEARFEVVGTAGDGRIALAKISQLHPDLVTLDIEMPVMNGLETLAEIRKTDHRIPIIMFSTLTERGAVATLEALSLGASDYATKPSNTGSPAVAIEQIRAELIPKIKALCAAQFGRDTNFSVAASKTVNAPATHLAAHLRKPGRRIEIVAIGTSTGGPNALARVIPLVPKSFPVPIVVVQHMPAVFTRSLAERLANSSEIRVEEGQAGAVLEPGKAWIAPGNYHMTVSKTANERRLRLNQDAPEHSCRPAVDVLFRSVAEAYGGGVLGVVMTGMGSDGVLGAQRIHAAGGEVIVQDEATSVVWGMPGLVQAAGEADGVFPLGELAGEIVRRVAQSRSVALGAGTRFYTVEHPVK
jgi:two-component system, chemotaxis family, protein-glutamate methylesterase/glutaminase